MRCSRCPYPSSASITTKLLLVRGKESPGELLFASWTPSLPLHTPCHPRGEAVTTLGRGGGDVGGGDYGRTAWEEHSNLCEHQMLTSRQQLSLMVPGTLTLVPCPTGDTLVPPQQVQPGEAPDPLPCLPDPHPRGLGAHSSLVGHLQVHHPGSSDWLPTG